MVGWVIRPLASPGAGISGGAAASDTREAIYAAAYEHAAAALIEKYIGARAMGGLNAGKIGAYSPGRGLVSGEPGHAFVVAVVYQGWDSSGRPEAKRTAPTTLHYADGLWIVDFLAVIPEFER